MNIYEVIDIVEVEVRDGFEVRLVFADGTAGVLDLGTELRGPMLEPLRRDPALFRAVKVEDGTIVWPNGADMAPDRRYQDVKAVSEAVA